MEDRWKFLSIARTKDIFIKPFIKSVNTQGSSGQNTRIENRTKKVRLSPQGYSSEVSVTAPPFNPAIRRTLRCPERAVPLFAPAFFVASPEDFRRTMI